MILLQKVDISEAAALEGATFGDRQNRLIDAAIKKLGDTYSIKQIEEKKKTTFEQVKAIYQEASGEYAQTEAQSNTLTSSKSETLTSSV